MTELERVAEQYANENYLVDEVPIPQVYAEAFMAGADWQYEQFKKERLKHCDELTAEQAQIESDFVVQHLKKCNRTPTFIDAIEYGMRLQKERHILKKDRGFELECVKCSLTDKCNRLEAICSIFKEHGGSYHFERDGK